MKKHHKPLLWISENVCFPPQAGSLGGKKVGPHLLKFQKDFITGILDHNGNVQKSGFIYGCRKISKTFLFSCLCWYVLNDRRKKGYEIPIVASTFEQGKILFNQIASQVNTPALKKKFLVRKDYILNRQTKSRLHVVFNASSSNLGLLSSGSVFDEIGSHRTPENLEVVQSGLTLSEGRPLLLYASNPPANLDHWVLPMLRAAQKDSSFIVQNHSLPLDEDWQKESNWIKINPFLKEWRRTKGKKFQNVMDNYRMLYRRGLETKESELSFRRLGLGQSLSSNEMQYIDVSKIKSVALEDFDFGRKDLTWSIGADISQVHDFSAISFCGYKPITEELFVFPMLFLPNANKRTPSQKRQFQKWAQSGYIYLQNNEVINPNLIFSEVTDFLNETKIKVTGVQLDPNLADQFVSFFEKNFPVAKQKNTGAEMTKSIRLLERVGNAGSLKVIGENPCVLWMYQNVICSQKSKNYVLLNRITPRQNIDSVVATALGLKYQLDNPNANQSL